MQKNVLQIVLDMEHGGLQHLVFDLIKKFPQDKNNYNFSVCCLDRGGIYCSKLEADNIYCKILKRRPVKFDFNLLFNLYKIIKNNNIDIIHSHSACIVYATLAGILGGVKKIIHTEQTRVLEKR